MQEAYLDRLVDHLRRRGIVFEDGLSASEVALIEQKYGFRFPADLRAFLQRALPVSKDFPNWRHGPDSELRRRLSWPLEGILADIEYNLFWLDEWGPRPPDLEGACAIARREVARAPVLTPVYSHRYLPCKPEQAGNPVLSVVQTDIIYYGNDLASYFNNEFRAELPTWAATSPRPIRFWMQLVS